MGRALLRGVSSPAALGPGRERAERGTAVEVASSRSPLAAQACCRVDTARTDKELPASERCKIGAARLGDAPVEAGGCARALLECGDSSPLGVAAEKRR